MRTRTKKTNCRSSKRRIVKTRGGTREGRRRRRRRKGEEPSNFEVREQGDLGWGQEQRKRTAGAARG